MSPGKNSLLADSALMFFANALGSLVGFSFHLAVARVGGPKVYADLGALISLNLIFSVAALSVQIFVSAKVAKMATKNIDGRKYLGKAIRVAAISGFCAAIVVALASPWIAKFFNLNQVFGVAIVGAIFLPLLVAAVQRGWLQGRQRFMPLAFQRALEPGVQLIVGISLVAAGFGATGAIGGTFTAILVVAIVNWKIAPPSFSKEKTSHDPKNELEYFARIISFLLFANLATNVDILLVKHHFLHEDAAQYTAAAFMSRILFLSALSIGAALFPKTATLANSVGRSLFWKAFSYFMIFAVPFVLFCTFFSQWIVSLFYGQGYEGAADLLPWMVTAYTGISAGYLAGTYRVSQGGKMAWVPFALAVVAQIVLVGFFPESLHRVAIYMIGCGGTILLLYSILRPEQQNG